MPHWFDISVEEKKWICQCRLLGSQREASSSVQKKKQTSTSWGCFCTWVYPACACHILNLLKQKGCYKHIFWSRRLLCLNYPACTSHILSLLRPEGYCKHIFWWGRRFCYFFYRKVSDRFGLQREKNVSDVLLFCMDYLCKLLTCWIWVKWAFAFIVHFICLFINNKMLGYQV